jgi:hypothetical protein
VRPGTGREAGLGHAGSDVKKILCGNKDQARSCRSGEKCGLATENTEATEIKENLVRDFRVFRGYLDHISLAKDAKGASD